MKWLFFQTLGGPRWGYELINPINEAQSKGRLVTFTTKSRAIFGDIYYRIIIIQRLIELVNYKWNTIKETLDEHKPEYEYEDDGANIKTGYAFDIDDKLRYELVAHLMNIFYQLNSCNEMLIKLATKLQVAIVPSICKEDAKKYFINLIESELGMSMEYKRLKKFRNYFTHHCTMRLSAEITEDGYELLIAKENLRDFRDESKFMRLAEVDGSIKHVNDIFTVITKDLKEKLDYLASPN